MIHYALPNISMIIIIMFMTNL